MRFFLHSALLLSILTLSTSTSFAQSKVYFDNFDARSGIIIREVKPDNAVVRTPGHPFTPGSFTTGDALIDQYITESGIRNGVDPNLLYSIMHQESSFKPNAVSYKGARGLMQLMPATAARFGVKNIFDPKQNIEGAARYVRFLLNTFDNDVVLTLAGYNAGEGAVMKYGRRVPPYRETQDYVRKITKRYELMQNPLYAAANVTRVVKTQPKGQLAMVNNTASKDIDFEKETFTVRMPDGKVALVNQ